MTSTGTKTLQGAIQLIFARSFQGWSGPGRNNIELHHEYGIHWRPENRASCRFNENGDLEAIVSVTDRGDKGSTMPLVAFTPFDADGFRGLGLVSEDPHVDIPDCGMSMPTASCAKAAELMVDPYARR